MPTAHTPIDLIGDIHGHADELKALLKKLGYKPHGGSYRHEEGRTVVFLGDYIDRGLQIKETLSIVRGMVDAGNAVALMGNHEYNALCYHTPDGKGGYLREHEGEKLKQHAATLEQFKGNEQEWAGYLAWFRTLPVWIDTDAFRAVHACWDPNHIDLLERELKSGFTKDVLERSTVENTPLWTAVEETLKGKELDLPDGITFPDKAGKPRKETRIRWWEHPEGRTYHDHSVTQESEIPKDAIMDHRHAHGVYGADEVPVFFGHYWLQVHPAILAPNVCCLDHSVAKEEGRLMAYRFDGERKLQFGKLVHVNRMTHA